MGGDVGVDCYVVGEQDCFVVIGQGQCVVDLDVFVGCYFQVVQLEVVEQFVVQVQVVLVFGGYWSVQGWFFGCCFVGIDDYLFEVVGIGVESVFQQVVVFYVVGGVVFDDQLCVVCYGIL